jgi:hypothetical protein
MNRFCSKCGKAKPSHLAVCAECYEKKALQRDREAAEAEAAGDRVGAAKYRLLAQVNRTEANMPAPSAVLDRHLFPAFED